MGCAQQAEGQQATWGVHVVAACRQGLVHASFQCGGQPISCDGLSATDPPSPRIVMGGPIRPLTHHAPRIGLLHTGE